LTSKTINDILAAKYLQQMYSLSLFGDRKNITNTVIWSLTTWYQDSTVASEWIQCDRT